jgi:hypothetical protein
MKCHIKPFWILGSGRGSWEAGPYSGSSRQPGALQKAFWVLDLDQFELFSILDSQRAPYRETRNAQRRN